MLIPSEEARIRSQFSNFSKILADLDIQKCKHSEIPSPCNFESCANLFYQIQNFFDNVIECDWDKFPGEQISDFVDSIVPLFNVVNEIIQFSFASENDPRTKVNNLTNRLDADWRRVYKLMAAFVGYQIASISRKEVAAGAEKFNQESTELLKSFSGSSKDELKSLKEEAEATRAEIKATANEAKSVLELARGVAREAGVTQQAEHFKQLADSYGRKAFFWALFAFVFGIISIFYALSLAPSQIGEKAALKPLHAVTNSKSLPILSLLILR